MLSWPHECGVDPAAQPTHAQLPDNVMVVLQLDGLAECERDRRREQVARAR